ncbi:MAG: hypothetical protein FWG50_10210, partial [Kiritimatiellaeota bacterium]|nr:hypothetical protein [Kiritimatiellota bacterium]
LLLLGLPVTQGEVGFLWGRVIAHEVGHLLGLVADNNVLGGGDSGWHNSPPLSRRQIMNAGESSTFVPIETRIERFHDRIGRDGRTWQWRELNKSYLKFILPKKEEAQ